MVAAASAVGEQEDLQRVAQFLIAKRTKRLDRLTVSEAARRITKRSGAKFGDSTLRHFEHARRMPTATQLVLIALEYGISPEDLHDLYDMVTGPDTKSIIVNATELLRQQLTDLENAARRDPDPAGTGALSPAWDGWEQLKARIDRQAAEIWAMPGASPKAKKKMEAGLIKHYEGLLDLSDAQLGLNTST